MNKLGVVMDPIAKINYKKDSTLAMLWEAKHRGFEIHYFEQKDLFLKDGKAYGTSRLLDVKKNVNNWYELGEQTVIELSEFNIILMRKDPPFNLEYIYSTYILDYAERSGVWVINRPQSLRDYNEKVFIMQFPECCPPSLITKDMKDIKAFLAEYHDIVVKPLDSMGGESIFRLQKNDINTSVILELMTAHGTRSTMAQRFIPEISSGDKRILLINGSPVPFSLARIPAKGELRGNLAAGGTGVAQALTERDYYICNRLAPTLREKGLIFVGIDVIGDYLTEINITSPTCIQELDSLCDLNISQSLFDVMI